MLLASPRRSSVHAESLPQLFSAPLLAFLPLVSSGPSPAAGDPLNVLLVVLDDVGIDALACYDDLLQAEAGFGPGMLGGGTLPDGARAGYAQTPLLNRLAAEGVRFDQFHSMPSCSPSRAAMQTGRCGFRTGIGSVIHAGDFGPLELGNNPMSTNELTLPDLFEEDEGCAFGLIGKYHLSVPAAEGGTGLSHPALMGWTSFRGTLRNLNQSDAPLALRGIDPGYLNFYWQRDGELNQEVGHYATTYECRSAEEFIRENAHQNWICVLALHACHAPFGPPTGGSRPYSGLYPPDADRTTWSGAAAYPDPEAPWDAFRAGLEAVDRQLDRTLRQLGPLLDDALVIVVGDNGSPRTVFEDALERGEDLGSTYVDVIDAQRLKGSIYRGGNRTPLIAWSPRMSRRGRTTDEYADAVDLFSTLLDATGPEAEQRIPSGVALDGKSLLESMIQGTDTPARTSSYREMFTPNGDPKLASSWQRAWISTDKNGRTLELIQFLSHGRLESEELYDLDQDPYEQNPLDLNANRESLRQLREQLAAAML